MFARVIIEALAWCHEREVYHGNPVMENWALEYDLPCFRERRPGPASRSGQSNWPTLLGSPQVKLIGFSQAGVVNHQNNYPETARDIRIFGRELYEIISGDTEPIFKRDGTRGGAHFFYRESLHRLVRRIGSIGTWGKDDYSKLATLRIKDLRPLFRNIPEFTDISENRDRSPASWQNYQRYLRICHFNYRNYVGLYGGPMNDPGGFTIADRVGSILKAPFTATLEVFTMPELEDARYLKSLAGRLQIHPKVWASHPTFIAHGNFDDLGLDEEEVVRLEEDGFTRFPFLDPDSEDAILPPLKDLDAIVWNYWPFKIAQQLLFARWVLSHCNDVIRMIPKLGDVIYVLDYGVDYQKNQTFPFQEEISEIDRRLQSMRLTYLEWRCLRHWSSRYFKPNAGFSHPMDPHCMESETLVTRPSWYRRPMEIPAKYNKSSWRWPRRRQPLFRRMKKLLWREDQKKQAAEED